MTTGFGGNFYIVQRKRETVFPFDPLSGAPAVWFDASDSSTITQNAGSISQWSDKSGNGNNLTQSTGANQPTVSASAQNGLNGVRFTAASSQYMSLSSAINANATGFTSLICYKLGSSGLQCFGNPSTDDHDFNTFIGDNAYLTGTTHYWQVTDPGTAAHVTAALWTVADAASAIYIDGVSQSISQFAYAGATQNYSVYGRYNTTNYSNATHLEQFFFKRVLSDGEVKLYSSYLKAKWATP